MLRRLILLLVTICFVPSLAAADGGFAKKRAALRQALAEPNQKALIYRDGGRETLLLQVKYEGDMDEFGWIVPVPSRPKLTAASIAAFYELADLTVPPNQLHQGKGVRGAGGGGVSVVEQVEVGPYDATVLAATDPEALTGWLREHDYALPSGAEDVLRPYVDRGWYYVALRIRAKEDLLSQFRRIDPGLRSLEDAPQRLTDVVMRLVDTQPSPGARKLDAIQKAIDSSTGEAEDPEITGGQSEFLERGYPPMMSYAYHSYVQARQELEAGQLPGSGMLQCVNECYDGPRGERFRAAAKQAGLEYHGSDQEVGRTLSVAVYHDLRNDVPYARSRFGKLHAALGRKPTDEPRYFADAYELARTALAETRRHPSAIVDVDQLADKAWIAAGTAQGVAQLLSIRNDLVVRLQQGIAAGCEAAQQALGGGTLAPLQLSFAAKELVYPLRISSLNDGTTKIQLYVLSDQRVAADGFDTAYAAPLEEQLLPWHRELWRLVGPGRTYLTKLVATMDSSAMDRDVVLTRSKSQNSYGTLDRPGRRGQRPPGAIPGGRGGGGGMRGGRRP